MSQVANTPQDSPKRQLTLAGKPADPAQIIERYLAGEKSEGIAKEYGVTRQGLSYWLRTNAETEWVSAQVISAVERRDACEAELDRIQSLVSSAEREEREQLTLALACARESLKSAQWTLERTMRRVFGNDVPVDAAGRVSISINLGTAERGQVIDAVKESAEQGIP